MPLRALSDEDVHAIVEFLATLNSRTEERLPPNAGIPASVPSGLPIDMPTLDDEPPPR